MLDVKINQLRIAMQKSDNLPNSDIFMIRVASRKSTGSNSG